MSLLDDEQITEKLNSLDGWQRKGDEIVRDFKLDDFVGSVKFVGSVVAPAERMGHHPDISISWNTVTVSISTHSEGGLTVADFELASEISSLA